MQKICQKFKWNGMVLTFESIVNRLVDKLNRENKPKNAYDRYELHTWYDCDPRHKRFALYHTGGRCTDSGWGVIAYTPSNVICMTVEEAYAALLKHYVRTVLDLRSFEFETPEELELKLAICGETL